MKDTDRKLSELISQGESETLEFKQKLPPESIISRILAAFANTKGGTLVIGVRDQGELIGLTEDEAKVAHQRLNRVARSLLSEPFDKRDGLCKREVSCLRYSRKGFRILVAHNNVNR
jgi:GTPase